MVNSVHMHIVMRSSPVNLSITSNLMKIFIFSIIRQFGVHSTFYNMLRMNVYTPIPTKIIVENRMDMSIHLFNNELLTFGLLKLAIIE